MNVSIIPVWIAPAQTAFTRTPSAAKSNAMPRVSANNPALVAAYTEIFGSQAMACTEEILTTHPLDCLRSGYAYLVQRKAPRRFVSEIAFQSSIVYSSAARYSSI